ncbi:MAG TPA: formate dehydrogenase accessory protein FdhE [Gemmatimonadaceae bacterium]|nr:formate dehydrogenase accessory protein FdhE [Gemmatimonadaceae bacterium]
MSPHTTTRRPTAASKTLAEQFQPIVTLHTSLRARGASHLDVDAARARIRAGRAAFDSGDVLRDAGDLTRAFQRTASALEHIGVASTPQANALQKASVDPTAHVLSWANGDSMPRSSHLKLARQVAAIVGNAVLARASDQIVDGFSLANWKRAQCPCCGASPDLALSTDRRRTLVCWRCDTMWRTDRRGCLSCGADSAPTLARVPSPQLGYELAICNSCGRYLKERRGAPANALLVERALTAGLDEAAQQRGLRA